MRSALFGLLLVVGSSAAAQGAFPAPDLNPHPDTVEVELVAELASVQLTDGGPFTEVWTYNGSTPGPTIQGETGQTFVIHFTNRLPEPTTVHWHGLDVPAVMDGSDIAQRPVPPGGTFRYEFTISRASMAWYHPHVRTNVQTEKGLYGMFVVRDPAEPLPASEILLALDDVLLDASGQIMPEFVGDAVRRAETALNGREGDVLLVNGVEEPTIPVRRGEPVRLRFLNAANARFMRVAVPGHTLWRVGGDGGLLADPKAHRPIADTVTVATRDPQDGLLLTPGERADVVFTPRGDGPIELQWHDWPRGVHYIGIDDSGRYTMAHHAHRARAPRLLATFQPIGDTDGEAYTPPARLREVVPLDTTGARRIRVTFGHTMPDENAQITFFTRVKNGQPLPFRAMTPADAPDVLPDETVVWEVTNVGGGDHNFHTHGFSFQPLDTRYVDLDSGLDSLVHAPFVEDKDTALLPGGTGAMGRSYTVSRFVQRFDDTGREGQIYASGKVPHDGHSGGWLFHCHMLEHSRLGMMGFFEVVHHLSEDEADAPPDPHAGHDMHGMGHDM